MTAGIAHFSIVYIGPAPQPRFDVHLLSETLIQIDAAPGTKIVRAHVGACPPDTACSPHPVGCVDADFAIQIRRIDAGRNITVTLSLDPASPLAGLLDFSVLGANPTPESSAMHLTHTGAADASGTLHVHATDGTTFGTCDIDYRVSLHI